MKNRKSTLLKERNKIELAINVIAKMVINNKTELIKKLTRVKAVKDLEILKLQE